MRSEKITFSGTKGRRIISCIVGLLILTGVVYGSSLSSGSINSSSTSYSTTTSITSISDGKGSTTFTTIFNGPPSIMNLNSSPLTPITPAKEITEAKDGAAMPTSFNVSSSDANPHLLPTNLIVPTSFNVPGSAANPNPVPTIPIEPKYPDIYTGTPEIGVEPGLGIVNPPVSMAGDVLGKKIGDFSGVVPPD